MSQVKKSARYLFFGGLFSKAVSFIGSIFLARLLFPEDYGLLLVAMLITGFIQLFGNIGFETFYLQEKIDSEEDEKKILSITYKLRLFVNGLLFFFQIAISYIVESYYNSTVIGEMIRVFALSIPIMALSQINLYILRKKLDYRPEVISNIARDVLGTLLKVLFAWMGFGALSFAIGAVAGNLLRYFVLIRFQKFKPDWKLWDKKLFEKIFYFGKHSFIGGIGMYFTQQVDKMLLSTYFPIATTGNYYFSNSQASSIFKYIFGSQSSLIISYSAKYKDKPDYLFSTLSKIGYLLGIVMLPIVVFVVSYSEPIFQHIFGEKWQNSVLMFQWFMVYYFLTELTFPFSGILVAFGFPQVASKLVIIRFIVLTIGLAISVYSSKDIYTYLATYLSISFIFSWIKAYMGIQKMDSKLINYIKKFKNLIFLGAIYIFIVTVINSFSNDFHSKLAGSFLSIVVVSFALHLTFFKDEFVSSLKLILNKNSSFLKRFE